jgi:hypothetical protein
MCCKYIHMRVWIGVDGAGAKPLVGYDYYSCIRCSDFYLYYLGLYDMIRA